ncbi:uncharacterized protein akap12a [Festucalex cinctus]
MGGAQSAFAEGEPGQDAAKCGVEDVQRCDEEKLLKKNGQIAAKSDTPLEEVDVIGEDDTDAGAAGLLEKPSKEVAAILENVVVNEKESFKEAKKEERKEEEISFDATEVEAKQNDESFKTFFSKVGLKLTLKQGSRDHGEIKEDGPEAKNPADQTRDDGTQVDTARERQNEDSKCPSEGEAAVLKDSQNETDEEWTHLDTPSEQEPSSPSSAKEDVTMSPIKKFFTTGIFAGFAKKRMSLEDETMTRELVLQEAGEPAKETTQNQQEDTGNTAVALADGCQEENPSANTISEPEAPKEFEDVPSSPLKRVLLSSSLMKLKRQKDANPSSSSSDQLLLQTDMAQNDKSPTRPAGTTVAEEESPWATFKKLLSPKKQVNRSAFNNEDVQIGLPKDELKQSEGVDILECKVEEGQKRKDSAISWDAVLCETSHTALVSDDKTSTDDVNDAEAVVVNYDDNGDALASTQKGGATPPEGNVESAWTAFKRLMSPKRKAKPVDERQHSPETDENSFSAKIFPAWKKRKSVSNKDQEATSCEGDQELGPGDPNSEMPAVVPLSDYDNIETEEPIETVVESATSIKTDVELNQDFLPEVTEEAQTLDNVQTEETQHDVGSSENEATNEDQVILTEFSGKALSDILEEGEITVSTTADDLIEITSQAVTAPHSVDVRPADDGDMISVLSQLSGQTSSATTLALAESQVQETEDIMQQVVESISTIPEANLLASDQIVSSALFDTLGTFGEDSQLPEVQKSNAPTTRTNLVVHEMDAAMGITESSEVNTTTEITTPISTEEFDTKEIISPIPTKALETKEITATIPTEELDTGEITPQIPTEELETTMTPPVPTEKLDTQEITPPSPTSDLDTKEITPTILTEEFDTKANKPSTKGLDNKETTPPTCTEEPDTEEITPFIPPEELDIKEIKPPFPTERLDTGEIIPSITTCKTRTPIQSEELNTNKITPPFLREELDNQEITPPIHTEELNTTETKTPMPTKELDTWEIIPPIRTEELATKEIKSLIRTKQLGIEEITPPARTEEPDTEEITPSILTRELGTEKIKYPIHPEELDTDAPFITEEIRTPIKTDDLNTKEIMPLVLTEELDTQETTPPIPIEELNTQEITPPISKEELDIKEISPPSPIKGLDKEELRLPIPTTKAHETEEISPPLPTEALDTNEIKLPIHTEDLHIKEILTSIRTQELDPEEIQPPTSTEEHDTEDITSLISTEGFNIEETKTQFLTKELDTNEITTPIPAEGLSSEQFSPQIPIQELPTKEKTPPVPTQVSDTEEIVPPIPTGESNTDELTLTIPTKELDIEASKLPIPTDEFDSKEITPYILIKEVDTKEISPPVPTEERDREELIPQIPTENFDAVEIMHPITTHEFDIGDTLPSIPIQMFDLKEIPPQLYTEELDTVEMTANKKEDSNLPKSEYNLNELDSFDDIPEFVDCLTDIKQGQYSEQLLESQDVRTEDDLEDLASNPHETEASKVDSVWSGVSVSMAEHESGDGGSRYLLEPVKQFMEEDSIPVVDELQRSKDVQDDTTNLQGDVTADTITNEPELETIVHTNLKETAAEQDILHLEEQEVKVTSEKVPEAITEELEPTMEILSEASLNPVYVSGAQTDVLDLQECSLQLAEYEILSEKVVSELKDTIEVLPEISIEPQNKDVAKTQVDTSIDELIKEIETVQAKPLESEKVEAKFVEKHDPPSEDVNDKNMPLLESNVETEEKDQKTPSDTQIELIKEDEDILVRDLSVKAKEISQSILAEVTMITEVKDRPVPLTEDKPVSEDQRANAELSPEQEVVQESCIISDEHKEVDGFHPHKTMTEEFEEKMAHQFQIPSESAKVEEVEVDASETELVKEIEGTQSKQSLTESGDTKEAIVAKEKITGELKEDTVRFPDVQTESDQKAGDVVKTELEGEKITEGIAEETTASVELKEKPMRLCEMNVEPLDRGEEAVNEIDDIKSSEALASEKTNAELLQSEETTESILVEEILPSEIKEEAEPLYEVAPEPQNKDRNQVTDLTDIMAKKTENTENEAMKCSSESEVMPVVSAEVQELEEITAVETETVEEVALSGLGVTDESIIRTPPKETLVEEITKSQTEDQIASKGEQTKPQPDQALDREEDPEPENTADDQLRDVMKGEKDGTQVTEAHVSLHQEEKSCAQILEKVIHEEISEVCGNLADKVTFEAHPSDTETRTEGENCDIPDVEMSIATVEHAVVAQVTMCHFKEVSTSLSNLITTPSGIQEPLLGSVEAESTETAVTESQMTADDLAETAQMSNEAVMMHVPATVMEDNNSIQVQVVHMDITSAERSVDQMLEVGVREKGVIDACNRNIEEVEIVSASMGVEEVMHEDYAVMCHEIVPHVMENLLETLEQMVSKEAKEVEFGTGDGCMELAEKELACPSENLAEAKHQEATPQGLEVPIHQESLEEKEDATWVLEAEELMALTDKVGKAPVANEEPYPQTDRYSDTEPTKEGDQTLVVQDSLRQMDPFDCQKEKDLTEGVQSPEPLSQIDLDECHDTKSTEKGFQTPKGEEPLSQIDREELSRLNLLAELKTTEQSEASLQAILAGDSVVSVDSHKETGITGENVQVQETEKHSCPTKPDKNQKLTKESCQTPKAEESIFQKEYMKDQKQEAQADKNIQPPKESTDTPKQGEMLEKNIPVRVNQELLPQKESTENQIKMELSKDHDQAGENKVPLPQKQMTEIQMEIQEKYVQASETQEPIPKKQSTETQKQMELSEENEQARENKEPIFKKEFTENQTQMEVPEKHAQARENQEFLPPKESTETEKRMALSEEYDQAGDRVPLLQKESTQIQKQMVLSEEQDQEGENQVPLSQKQSTKIQMEIQEKYLQAKQTQEPIPEKQSTETQKQVELSQEHERARERYDQVGENQVHLTQKESTETQKQTELQEEYVQASETLQPIPPKESTETQKQMELSEEHDQAGDRVPLLQKESTEIQKQMELQEEHGQAGENQVPLLQIESTETQKQTEAPEKNTQVRENQVLSPPKEPTETKKLTELLKEHVQSHENQEPLPQNESTETKKQMEVPDENVQVRENQVLLPHKVSTETQKQPEQTEECVQTPEMEMTSFPKESAIGQKLSVQMKETSEVAKELDSTGITVTTEPPVLLDSGLQTIKTEAAVEETVATTNETLNLQATETSQTAQKPETEAPVREADDEQDIWTDAKEEMEIQEEKHVSAPQDESPRHDDSQGTKTTHAEESKTVPNPDRQAESESEGDDFTFALDDSKTESVAAMECD